MKPTYFDLTVADVGRARGFFERVLGWQFEKFGMPYEYYRIKAGSEAEPGGLKFGVIQADTRAG